jgi:hypothetical protein
MVSPVLEMTARLRQYLENDARLNSCKQASALILSFSDFILCHSLVYRVQFKTSNVYV